MGGGPGGGAPGAGPGCEWAAVPAHETAASAVSKKLRFIIISDPSLGDQRNIMRG